MGLLDVNALVALAWDSHIHHASVRSWMRVNGAEGWATCPLTESGFVRVSSNPKVLPSPIGTAAARAVLAALRGAEGHSFLADDVSQCDPDVPEVHGYRQVTDAHLLTIARRHRVRLVTFDARLASLSGHEDVELLTVV